MMESSSNSTMNDLQIEEQSPSTCQICYNLNQTTNQEHSHICELCSARLQKSLTNKTATYAEGKKEIIDYINKRNHHFKGIDTQERIKDFSSDT
jgi:hypothetical protein